MKKIYTSMILVFMTASSFAQQISVKANSATIENDQIVAMNENQIISIEEVAKTSNDDTDFRYYYFPNMYAYYDLQNGNYIYKINNKWQTSSELPQYYGGYSLFKNTKIPIKNYVGDNPQENINQNKKDFPYIKKSRMLKTLKFDGNTAISSLN